MVGITYDKFNPGEPCWIVINSTPREYYLGEFLGNVPRDSYAQHRVAHKWHDLPVKAVRAKLIDYRVEVKNELALPFFGEPLCDYGVLPYRNHSAGLEMKIDWERMT